MVIVRDIELKRKIATRYNKKVIPCAFKKDDLVLCKADIGGKNNHQGKLVQNWEGLYKVVAKIEMGAYVLETLSGDIITRTWNTSNLHKYYS